MTQENKAFRFIWGCNSCGKTEKIDIWDKLTIRELQILLEDLHKQVSPSCEKLINMIEQRQ